jgi:predicted Zn finger-like uncharacterized protein
MPNIRREGWQKSEAIVTRTADCPACGQQLAVDDNQAGQSVRCPACARVFAMRSSGRSDEITSEPLPALRLESRQRAKPRKSRPLPEIRRRGIAGLVLGIVALVLGVGALAVSWLPFICAVSMAVAGLGVMIGATAVLVSIYQRRGLAVSITAEAVNLLALMVSLLVMFVSSILLPDLQQSYPLELQEEMAKPVNWGMAVDPDGDCLFSSEWRSLLITVPPTAHDLSVELGRINAPRVLQEVEGDFAVEVEVCGMFFSLPQADAAVPGRPSFQSAGLLLWADERNYIRLERAALNRDGAFKYFASLEMRKNAVPTASPPVGMRAQDAYLRLERHGNQILGSVSATGRDWTPLQPLNVDLPSKVQVGVAVVNAVEQPLQIRFQEFKIEKK